MKAYAYLMLAVSAALFVSTPALAEIDLVFKRGLELKVNRNSEAGWVATTFDKADYFQAYENIGMALRGCIIEAWTEPNDNREIQANRKLRLERLPSSDQNEGGLSKYRLKDVETGAVDSYVKCFQSQHEEPNVLNKMRDYLGAVPVNPSRRVPINFQSGSQEERFQLLQPLLKEEAKSAEEAVEL